MFFYQIYLPLGVNKSFIYKYSKKISPGVRVIVSFNNKYYTAIVGNEIEKPPNVDFEIKSIVEVVDKEPIISKELQTLANWISNYYFASKGLAYFAMLPSALDVNLQLKIRKIKNVNLPDSNGMPELILNKISSQVWTNISELKKETNLKNLHYWLEKLESNGAVEIYHSFDKKIKKKTVNYVKIEDIKTLPKLTPKQNEVYSFITNLSSEFPLSKIAKKYSYSMLKTLRNKGLISIYPKTIKEKNTISPKNIKKEKDINLNEEQKIAFEKINKNIDTDKFDIFTLFGVTGSGKTEIYIQLIRRVINKGKSALLLVPEISLTPQMLSRFFARFSNIIAVLHSNLNERERYNEWVKIKSGQCKIVIGVRSAIFSPLKNLGIIIVDEEHETTYKQDKAPRYNARDLATVRGKMNNAVVVLGSATPSLESYFNAIDRRYDLLKLKQRVNLIKMPDIEIIDLRREQGISLFSELLKEKIKNRLAAGEQINLFHNRRGYASFAQCINCGKLFECPNCNISLRYHSFSKELKCHYCGHKKNMPRKCPDCGGYLYNFGSAGTQQAENQLKLIFPEARILRMDADTTHKKDSYTKMFDKMKNGYIDILLGTQMISKGLDFPNVTLVGVISADTSLNLPDFRASEKTFQLLTQVAGRAGRGKKKGEVVIQTYNPDHYAVKLAKKHDMTGFFKEEISLRKKLFYPPFYRLARVLLEHKNHDFLKSKINENMEKIKKIKYLFDDNLKVLGPVPAPFEKLKSKYRYHIIIKAVNVSLLSKYIQTFKENIKFVSSIKTSIDVDPQNLL